VSPLALSKLPFNVNHFVWVRLTDVGLKHLRTPEHEWRLKFLRTEDGWSQWQLWDLMYVFGPLMGNGFPVPFETTVKLETWE
jgi:hypothetical protein